jgi:hypothetical protein
MPRSQLEVADVVREYGDLYREKYGQITSPQQWRALHAIEICRTEALGGHIDECDECGHQVISYNSCRNRHCPKCQAPAKAKWLKARRSELLPVEYFHVVFTVPEVLTALALQNRRVAYNVLFQAASRTLLTIAADPKHLGAQIGFLAILHTWGQNLMAHPHLHCVVPGGGVALKGEKWVSCPKGFFLPVRVLSRLFRRLFLSLLKDAFLKEKLQFHGRISDLSEKTHFDQLLESCRKVDWVVYAKPPIGGPEKVLDYLGRYTHRVAISNNRLLAIHDGKVSFSWKDYRHGSRRRTMTLPACEFIRRFLLHVLPDGFVRIRYYGFLANCHRAEMLEDCRRLSRNAEEDKDDAVQDQADSATGEFDHYNVSNRCPKCKRGHMVRVQALRRKQWPSTRAPP